MNTQGGRARVGKYEMERTLGRGSFAKVKLAKNMETGEYVAIKILDKEKVLQREMIEQTKREISTMKLIKHQNVIQLHEVLASKTKIYIVMEYASGGVLLDKISKHERLREEEARKYFQQLINAVDYCHSRGVYHRDLKPENLLLDTDCNLKVSDFGLSALSQQVGIDWLLHTTCGTPNYMAPEVIISSKGYDGATVDLWSCGVILFVLMAGYLPFDEPNFIVLCRKINKADFTCPSWLSSSAKKLITRILDPNPKTRITIPEILENEWFKKDYRPPEFQEDVTVDGVAAAFNDSEEFLVQQTQPVLKNAFELITKSRGLNLNKLFDKTPGTVIQETLFTYKQPAKEIISKIEEAARPLGFDVQKQNYKLKLRGTKMGRKGHLSVATTVSEVAPSLVMVEFCKAGGHTLEFHEFFKNISAGLKNTMWNSQVNMERSK